MHLISAMCSVVKVGRISQQFKKRLAFIDGVLIDLFIFGRGDFKKMDDVGFFNNIKNDSDLILYC